jgi:hypothetical protein
VNWLSCSACEARRWFAIFCFLTPSNQAILMYLDLEISVEPKSASLEMACEVNV